MQLGTRYRIGNQVHRNPRQRYAPSVGDLADTGSSQSGCLRTCIPECRYRDLSYRRSIYESVDLAKADLDAIEQLHKDDLVGTFDTAVVDRENGKPHIVKRMARPMVQVIPHVVGDDFDALLPYDQLHGVAAQLSASEAGLIVVGEPTLDKAFDKAFDKAVTHATKTLKHIVDVTADELAKDMKEAART